MPLLLKDPVIIGQSGEMLLLIDAADIDNTQAKAQLWSPEIGYTDLWSLVTLRESLQFKQVNPPQALFEPLIGAEET